LFQFFLTAQDTMLETLLATVAQDWQQSSTSFFHPASSDESLEDCCGRLILTGYLPRVVLVGDVFPSQQT
jgi:hypothetical protein